MNNLLVPGRAHLMPSRLEEAVPDEPVYNFNHGYFPTSRDHNRRYPTLVQRTLSYFILEIPSLPFTIAHHNRQARIREDSPLETKPQRLAGRTIRPHRLDTRGYRDSHRAEAEVQSSDFEFESTTRDSREAAHTSRKNALGTELQAMLGDGANVCVLLCWGGEYECSVRPVTVSDSADETIIWEAIRQAWCSHRCWWRRYIPFPGVKSAELVEISIAGMNLRSPGGAVEFVGMYKTKDLQVEKRRLQSIIENYQEHEYPCPYNPSTGKIDCFETCASYYIDVDCPEKTKFEAERQLENLETRPLMKLAFSNPKLASLNDFLQGEKVIYGHSDILMMMNEWHRPKLREMKFRGILIKEAWGIKSRYTMITFTMASLFSALIAAKLTFGEWGTAWNVGSFFLALGSFLYGMSNTERDD